MKLFCQSSGTQVQALTGCLDPGWVDDSTSIVEETKKERDRLMTLIYTDLSQEGIPPRADTPLRFSWSYGVA